MNNSVQASKTFDSKEATEKEDKSPFSIEKTGSTFDPIDENTKHLIIEVLKPLNRCSIAGAINIFNNAKKVLLNCTCLHSEDH